MILFADGCTRRNANFHPSVDRDGIAIDAEIAGACTPIVWPRADGSLPDPPPPVPEVLRALATTGLLPEPDEAQA